MRATFLALVSAALLSGCTVVSGPAQPAFPHSSPDTARTAADTVPVQDQMASDKYGPEAGESLLQFGGAVTRQAQVPGQGDNTSILLQGGIGWFKNDWLEVGGQVLGNFSMQSGPDTALVSISPYVNGNYKLNPRLWLYAGPHLGLGYLNFASDSATSIEYGLHGGTRYWLDPRTSVFGELRYTHSSFSIAGFDLDSDVTQLLFGFSVVF